MGWSADNAAFKGLYTKDDFIEAMACLILETDYRWENGGKQAFAKMIASWTVHWTTHRALNALYYIHTKGIRPVITQDNRDFVNFLFGKLLTETDSDMIDLHDDDTAGIDALEFEQLTLSIWLWAALHKSLHKN